MSIVQPHPAGQSCKGCGDCCNSLEFGPILFNTRRKEWIPEMIRWVTNHGSYGEFNFEEREDGWYLIVLSRCRYLNMRTRECLCYENRPLICREYDCRKKVG